jgi:hypothetical protein
VTWPNGDCFKEIGTEDEKLKILTYQHGYAFYKQGDDGLRNGKSYWRCLQGVGKSISILTRMHSFLPTNLLIFTEI